MLKTAAMATGIVFLAIGVLGFIPAFTTASAEGVKLLGIFEVDPVHNIVHIVSGLAFLAAAQTAKASRMTFQVFGVVYALVTLLGFLLGTDGRLLGLFHINAADNFLHLFLTAAFLYLGFGTKPVDDHRDTATTAV